MSMEQIRQHMEHDPFARFLGIELLELGEGYSRVALTVQDHMLNFHGLPHGGVIFSLADAAFAAACNSHGQVAVALNGCGVPVRALTLRTPTLDDVYLHVTGTHFAGDDQLDESAAGRTQEVA